jgi:hypothetical protein
MYIIAVTRPCSAVPLVAPLLPPPSLFLSISPLLHSTLHTEPCLQKPASQQGMLEDDFGTFCLEKNCDAASCGAAYSM